MALESARYCGGALAAFHGLLVCTAAGWAHGDFPSEAFIVACCIFGVSIPYGYGRLAQAIRHDVESVLDKDGRLQPRRHRQADQHPGAE